MSKDFPINVFPDVERNAFKKFSKKNVTEDYIKENLKRKGWDCYKPFTDTGIDLLATKVVDGKRLYRYIQIKTRSLVNDRFGYTLKSKDFITDPRKFYFLYCDTMDDVIIISTFDYLKLCKDNYQIGLTHFGNPAFRNGNNKLNSLTYSNGRWTWSYSARGENPAGIVDFTEFLNDLGLAKMEDTYIEDNFENVLDQIVNMKFQMFYRFNKTRTNESLFNDDNDTGNFINNSLIELKNKTNGNYIEEVNSVKNEFRENEPVLFESHSRYIVDEMLRGDSND